MTIQYKGKNIEEGRKHPEAYITYDENKEQEKADMVFDFLRGNGWVKLSEEEGCAVIPLVHKDEYLTLVKYYKIAKKVAGGKTYE